MELNMAKGAEFDGRRFALTLLALVVATVVIKAAAVYLGVSWLTPQLLVLSLLMVSTQMGASGRKMLLYALGCVVALTLLAGAIPDATWDGNMYHKPAIVALHDGWNPWLFPEFSDWLKTRDEVYYAANVWQNNENSLWISHYPNLSWLYSAALMDVGFGWESGKSLSLILAVALYAYASQMLRQYELSTTSRTLISGLLVLCPPWIVQVVTNYVDGVTYVASTLIVVGILDKDRCVEVDSIIWCGLIILAGVKFTGALYAVLFVVPFLVIRRPSLRQICGWTLVGALALSHPYLNHLASGLNIGYPVTGSDRVLSGQVEEDVAHKVSLVALTRSLLARTSNGFEYSGEKVPGTLHAGEIGAAGSPDARHGGFGPWYSLALVFCFAAVVFAAYAGVRRKGIERKALMLLGAALFLAICTLIHPAAWWARYVPFFYTGVLLLAIFALTSGLPTARRLGMLSLIVLAGNAFLVMMGAAGYAKSYAIKKGYAVDRQVAATMSRDPKILVRAPEFVAFASLYHLRNSLGIQELMYEPADLGTSPGCTSGQSLGIWIGLAQFCEAPRNDIGQ